MRRFLPLFILVFLLSACQKTSPLDTVTAIVTADGTLPQGSILTYGKRMENAMSEDTLSDYLGLAGYPEFAGKIEEMAVYSALSGDYCELCVLRLYSVSDAADATLFLERRITDAVRALKLMGKTGYADTAFVEAHGNTVALFMLPDNTAARKAVF